MKRCDARLPVRHTERHNVDSWQARYWTTFHRCHLPDAHIGDHETDLDDDLGVVFTDQQAGRHVRR